MLMVLDVSANRLLKWQLQVDNKPIKNNKVLDGGKVSLFPIRFLRALSCFIS